MNYLLTLDTNLVDDMIGLKVLELRMIKETRLNYKQLNNEFKSAFTNYCNLFSNGQTDKEKIESLINSKIEYLRDFWELNSVE